VLPSTRGHDWPRVRGIATACGGHWSVVLLGVSDGIVRALRNVDDPNARDDPTVRNTASKISSDRFIVRPSFGRPFHQHRTEKRPRYFSTTSNPQGTSS
jgi:hypothetical protein